MGSAIAPVCWHQACQDILIDACQTLGISQYICEVRVNHWGEGIKGWWVSLLSVVVNLTPLMGASAYLALSVLTVWEQSSLMHLSKGKRKVSLNKKRIWVRFSEVSA